MVVAAPNETSVASAPVDASFEDPPVTATVSPAPQAASATADAGFGDLGAPVQPSAPTANTGNDKDADLDARAGGLPARAPSVLNEILQNEAISPRHRIEAAKELRQVAAGARENIGTGEQFIISVDLGEDRRLVKEFEQPVRVPGDDGDAQ
jgi:hypothetical protein